MSKLIAAFRWLGAVFVTIGFLGGIPMLLIAAPSPFDSERGTLSIIRAIGSNTQIFDEALVSTLVGLAWILWAYLAVAAFVELISAARGGVASIRGLRMGQSFARPVVAALMWSTTATGLVASTIGAGTVALMNAPTAAAQPVALGQGHSHDDSSDRHGFGQTVEADEVIDLGDQTFMIRGSQVRPHLVQADDTLWDLADEHFGDAFRWREIASLNPDIDDPDLIIAGTIIYMPTDAVNINLPNESSDGGLAAATSVTVSKGDTVWDLSADHLAQQTGEQPQPAEIAVLVDNVDSSQLMSGDPDVIYPGETIDLGADEADDGFKIWVFDGPDVDPPTATEIGTTSGIEGPAENLAADHTLDGSPSVADLEAQTSADGVALAEPPAGQFLGEMSSDARPPVPSEDGPINAEEVPPTPSTADNSEHVDRSNGWDPPAADIEVAEAPLSASTPTVPIPAGDPVQPETNTTVNPDDLAESPGTRTVKSVNWSLLLGAVPLLGGGVWAALRRRRRLKTSRRPSRYKPAESTEAEVDITNALAGSSALERAARLEALSARIVPWVPVGAPQLVAVTIDNDDAAVLWDAELAPQPVGEADLVSVEGSTWRVALDELADVPPLHPLHGLPALIHLGRLMSGRDLFVNLEELQRVDLEGDPNMIEQLCGRLAMELALSPLFDLGTLMLVGFGKQLESIENVEYYETSEAACSAVMPRLGTLNRAMSVDSALQLRASGQLETNISPIVVIDLSDEAPHEDLISAAEASFGGLCLLHTGQSDSRWPVTVDTDSVHIGGSFDQTLKNIDVPDGVIDQIMTMVSAGIEYKPADTVEGKVSDSLNVEVADTNNSVDEWEGEASSIVIAEATATIDDEASVFDELVAANWADPDPLSSETGVRLRMLGAVTIEGAEFSKRAARYVELIALMLAKGGKITVTDISNHMYAGDGNPQAIHQLLTRTRRALGDTPDGEPRLSFETPTKQYELRDVSSDYQQVVDVCKLIKANSTLSHIEASQLMDSAVQLIEGPPYAGAGHTYEWIYTHGDATDAVIAADSLCRELGEVYLALGIYARARWSIRQGLKACPACDELYDALIRVTAAEGTSTDLSALWTEIQAAYAAADKEVPQTLADAYGSALAA